MDSYHSQHSPFGSFASFTVGLVGSPGGFGQSLSGPADQNVYVGYRRAGGHWKLLPFFAPPESQASAFTGEVVLPQHQEVVVLTPNDYERRLELASDTWTSGEFAFTLHSPFRKVPDPSSWTNEFARELLVPAVSGTLEYNNVRGNAPVELIFGLRNPPRPLRPLQDVNSQLEGFAQGGDFGFTTVRGLARCIQGFSLFGKSQVDPRGLFLQGNEAGLVFTVPAGKSITFPLALGFYQAGIVTTGLSAAYFYTRFFAGLEDVLLHALESHPSRVAEAAQRNRELASSGLNEHQQFLIAQAVHSYYGSTQLLCSDDQPLWVVNEGEYRMINTFDLAIDQIFFELEWHPWAVRNVLDLFVERYSYRDNLRSADGSMVEGGISFTHDMGVMNHFTPPGLSSYECVEIEGCFSHMTMEQLVNWILCAVTYSTRANNRGWLAGRANILHECAESLRRRDNPEPAHRDGILKCDSSRCGAHGAEITTYDSLDVSLGQARNNLYLSVKALAAWLLLAHGYEEIGEADAATAARESADLAARALSSKFETSTGCFPAVFENGNHSRILPSVEGFAFPLFLNMKSLRAPTVALDRLLTQFRSHLVCSLQPGICLDAVSGGWKLSSTSTNTWFSKIALAQYVVRRLFPEVLPPAAAKADGVHAHWQRTPRCGANAMCDQINSETGAARGSRYYPRCVTTWLWLHEANFTTTKNDKNHAAR